MMQKSGVARSAAMLACIAALTACTGSTEPRSPIAPRALGDQTAGVVCTSPNLSVADDGHTIVVSPSGTDDTGNLQCALDQVPAGGTVRLTDGVFNTSRLTSHDFDGRIVGAGIAKTIVHALPSLPCNTLVYGYRRPHLLALSVRRLAMSDIQFSVEQFTPCQPYIAHHRTQYMMDAIVEIIGDPGSASDRCDNPPTSRVDVRIERVAFVGAAGTSRGGYNVNKGVSIIGNRIVDPSLPSDNILCDRLITGQVVLRDNEFRHMTRGIAMVDLTNGRAQVGEGDNGGNVFDDNLFALDAEDNGASTVDVAFNTVTRARLEAVYFEQGVGATLGNEVGQLLPAVPPVHVHVANNTIHATALADGVALVDDESSIGLHASIAAVVEHNDIVLEDTQGGGVAGLAAQNVVVASNTISGHGLAGIYMSVFGDACAGWVIAQNDVSHLTADVARIWLGPASTNMLVVGAAPGDVRDEGMGNRVR